MTSNVIVSILYSVIGLSATSSRSTMASEWPLSYSHLEAGMSMEGNDNIRL